MISINEFQQDLRTSGETLDKTLKKHGLTLKKALDLCPVPQRTRNNPYYRNGKPKIRNIAEHQGRFVVRKYINGKYTYFGFYETLEEAIKVREICVECGWRKEEIDRYKRLH